MLSAIRFNLAEITLLLGTCHGFFLGIALLVRARTQGRAQLFLALPLFITAWQLFVYALNISGHIAAVPHLANTAFPFVFLIGPAFYFHAQLTTHPASTLRPHHLLHVLPCLVVLLQTVPYYALDTATKIEYLRGGYSPGLMAVSTTTLLHVLAHLSQLAAYLYATLRLVRRREGELQHVTANSAVFHDLARLKTLTGALIVYLGLFVVTFVLLVQLNAYRFEIDFVWLLTKSLFIHAFGYLAISRPLTPQTQDPQYTEPQEDTNGQKYERSGLAAEQAAYYTDKLDRVMREKKPYLNSDLKLADLSQLVELSPNLLSQIINQYKGTRFNDFINAHRIEHAQSLLRESDGKTTILHIALAAGFNNKATFNRLFKQHTQQTPSDYKKRRNE